MTSDAQKRQYVVNLYPGDRWKRRVEAMPDTRVTAIYLEHVHRGTKPVHEVHPHFDLPPRDPHHNEDDFPIY